jgi:hypothetical protein
MEKGRDETGNIILNNLVISFAISNITSRQTVKEFVAESTGCIVPT